MQLLFSEREGVMKKVIALAVVLSVFCVFPGFIQAETVPKVIELFTDQALATTATADSRVQNLGRGSDIGGNFALMVDANSSGGVADLKIEFLVYNEASDTWTTDYVYYDARNDVFYENTGLIIDSTVTRLSRQGQFIFFPVTIPLTDKFFIRFTGVGSNPADTVFSAQLVRK